MNKAQDVLFDRVKVSLEDYLHQTDWEDPLNFELIMESCESMNHDKLSKKALKEVADELHGVLGDGMPDDGELEEDEEDE